MGTGTYLTPAKHRSHLKENKTEFIPELLQAITAQEHRFKLTQIRVAMRKLVSENFTVTAQSSVKFSV